VVTASSELYFGTLDATFSVDANGCTGYSIPLSLPPGTHGFADIEFAIFKRDG
jgi:hypothetical protein